ncbi:hypothetical protein LZZ90_11100 [Flavobacterium sp. SM15]|uniref:hypothetical protein n=1 Tax=Flavobacterium sp. SM15 TaxID=2908005 RepID=UPI001EDC7B36|nr:hypothetical protein [Flavobacterium sp. SM15]MCG2612055.1 hypothetical protein [Flavobacterium sp. SM15]
MKKSVAIALLSLYLLGTTQLRELLKIPVLIEHFTEHRKQNPIINFWDFLCEHYADYNHSDKDYDRDMQLPFKTLTHSASDLAFFPTIDFECELPVKKIPADNRQNLVYAGFIYTSTYLSSIWQPPKSC